MAGLSGYDCDGTLTIGGIAMNRAAWGVFGNEQGDGSMFDLLTGVDQRGEDRILPYTDGVIAFPRLNTVTTHALRLIVVGDVDQNGAANADHTAGLVVNLQYIMDNVVAPVASATGTRAATYTPPGSSALTADIHVTRLNREALYLGTNAVWEGTMSISIPAGAFA